MLRSHVVYSATMQLSVLAITFMSSHLLLVCCEDSSCTSLPLLVNCSSRFMSGEIDICTHVKLLTPWTFTVVATTIYAVHIVCIHQKPSILRFNPWAVEVPMLPIESPFVPRHYCPFFLLVQLLSTLRGSLLTTAPLITRTSATPDPTIWTSVWSKAHPFICTFPKFIYESLCVGRRRCLGGWL